MSRKQSPVLHDHDRGLMHDLQLINARLGRRRMLGWLAGASLVPLISCAQKLAAGGGGGDAAAGSGGEASDGSCSNIPSETGGPYPGDGSNGVNALALSGIVRSDIRSSLAGLTGTAQGVPLEVKLRLLNTADGCAPLEGYAIYLWHCDRDGNYSLYTLPTQNYLRGVQETDNTGSVTFKTIFPGCYSGRMPHIHFEVYPGLSTATSSANKLHTSQLALPTDACNTVYASSGYSSSVSNLSRISFETDNVFSDGVSLQLASVTGSVNEGYIASLDVGIAD
jgi:protocatechuate 3,4-dioxygenase beta subunit